MKIITTRKLCPDCKKGELVATGNGSSNSRHTTYEHKCNKCYTQVEYPDAYINSTTARYSPVTDTGHHYLSESYPKTEHKYTKKEKIERWEK